MLRKIVQPFYTFYAAIVFCTCFAIAFLFNLIFIRGRNIAARKKAIRIYRLCFRFWLWAAGMPLRVEGRYDGRYVFIANHSSYIDDIIIFPAISTHFRALGKIEMTRIPVWGYQYKRVVVLVDRRSPDSRTRSMQEMAQVIREEGSMLIFPEGTFNETGAPLKNFYDGAFRLAIETGTPVAPIIFPDASYRAHHSAWWKIWPGRNRAIYLPPIPVTGMTQDDLPALKQQAYLMMEKALTEYQIA